MGALVGATKAGLKAYGITEADSAAGIANSIIAVVAGAVAGTLADEYRSRSDGVEYILAGADGKNVAIVQSIACSDETAAARTELAIVRGRRGLVRVIPTSN